MAAFFCFYFCFYIPGRVIIEKRFRGLPRVVVWISGIAMWGWQAYVFGWLHMRWMTLVYLGIFFVLGKGWKMGKPKINVKLVMLIIAGAGVMLPGVATSALPDTNNIKILGINTIDGSYHLALIESLKRGIPPQEPGMVSETVKNYHYWSDMILADILRICPLNNFWLFYHYFPILVVILLGAAAYEMGIVVSGKKSGGWWFCFMIMFAGNFDWLVWKILKGEWSFGMASLDNAAILMTNPPRALAETVWTGGMIILYRWIKEKKESWGWLTIMVLTTTVGLKIYVGMAVIIQLLVLGWWWWKEKLFYNWRPLIAAAGLSLFIFLPGNFKAGGFKWEPFAWPRQYFAEGQAGKLMWQNQEDEFEIHNNNLRLTILHWQMLVTFLVILYGTRILGWWGVKKFVVKNRPFGIGVVMVLMIFSGLGLFFVQKSGPFELFNFLAVAGVLLSLAWTVWAGQRKIPMIWIMIIVLLTVPRTIYQASDYLIKWRAGTSERKLEITENDIKFFKEGGKLAGNNLVLTETNDDLGRYSPFTVQLAGWKMYFDGDGVLRAHGLETRTIKEKTERWLATIDEDKTKTELKESSVKYFFRRGERQKEYEKLTLVLQQEDKYLYELW